MALPIIAVVFGLALLVWSGDQFVDGSAATARHFGAPPLLIGMVIVGFGTSAPELVVSAFAALSGNPGIALGNAYGSNIANIALILGLTALISPIAVKFGVLRRELPVLVAITALAAWQVRDGAITRTDALILLGVFALLVGWSIRQGLKVSADSLAREQAGEPGTQSPPIRWALVQLVGGLVLLVTSSRILVWGAVAIAHGLGVSDLIIGLTIVAVGTSLPELASSMSAIRRGEDDIALGNVIGSNFFNTLAVVGLAGAIHPMTVEPEVFTRDIPVMAALTLSIFITGFRFRGAGGRINRMEGAALLACYIGYNALLVRSVLGL